MDANTRKHTVHNLRARADAAEQAGQPARAEELRREAQQYEDEGKAEKAGAAE